MKTKEIRAKAEKLNSYEEALEKEYRALYFISDNTWYHESGYKILTVYGETSDGKHIFPIGHGDAINGSGRFRMDMDGNVTRIFIEFGCHDVIKINDNDWCHVGFRIIPKVS